MADTLLSRLAKAYSTWTIEFPQLRAVSLAQWLIESGRATSALATDHYNFGGLKWRPEMAPHATSVRYTAHDGTDDYCAFATIEKFLAGYWAFLERAPYQGWKTHVATPEDFIRFIGPIYCPPNPAYALNVIALIPEAQALLDAAAGAPAGPPSERAAPAPGGANGPAGAVDLGTIVLDPGHGGSKNEPGSSSNNATSVSGVEEKVLTLEFCTILRDQLLAQAAAAGKTVKVVMTRDSDINLPGAARAGLAYSTKAKLLLSVHFNGGVPEAHGTETFYSAAVNGNLNLAEDVAFAQTVQAAALDGFKALGAPWKDRGVKPDTDTKVKKLAVLNDINLGNNKRPDKCRAALLEVEFITNPAVDKLLISGADAVKNRTAIMRSVAAAMLAKLA